MSSRRPLVHDPMTTCWIGVPSTASTGFTLSTVCGQAICGASAAASTSNPRS